MKIKVTFKLGQKEVFVLHGDREVSEDILNLPLGLGTIGEHVPLAEQTIEQLTGFRVHIEQVV